MQSWVAQEYHERKREKERRKVVAKTLLARRKAREGPFVALTPILPAGPSQAYLGKGSLDNRTKHAFGLPSTLLAFTIVLEVNTQSPLLMCPQREKNFHSTIRKKRTKSTSFCAFTTSSSRKEEDLPNQWIWWWNWVYLIPSLSLFPSELPATKGYVCQLPCQLL